MLSRLENNEKDRRTYVQREAFGSNQIGEERKKRINPFAATRQIRERIERIRWTVWDDSREQPRNFVQACKELLLLLLHPAVHSSMCYSIYVALYIRTYKSERVRRYSKKKVEALLFSAASFRVKREKRREEISKKKKENYFAFLTGRRVKVTIHERKKKA